MLLERMGRKATDLNPVGVIKSKRYRAGMTVSVGCISLGNCQLIRCINGGSVLPHFQYAYQNFPKQFHIIFRIFFFGLSTRYFKFIIFLLLACTFNLIPLVTHAAQVTLAWDASLGPVAGYKVYYGTTSDNYDYSVNVGNFTSCTISGIQEGATYYFATTAHNDIGESDYSEEIAYTIPITTQLEEIENTIPINTQPSDPVIYISDISINLFKKGPNYQARANAIVWDEIGSAVKATVVSGQWFLNGKYINEVSASSDRKGVAKFSLNKVRAQSGDELTLMITDVAKDGYSYDSGSNIADEISKNIP
jgi:hypothetical protein